LLIGIDIIDIDRIRKSVERTPRFLHRVFTPQEIDYCMKKTNPYPSLAVRFAAKEAVRKLDPVFSSGIKYHEVEIVIKQDGRPELCLYGKAEEKGRQAGINGLAVSLSHANEQAVAAVVASKG
jgi:holo-[acyl-carrier protein] synthase